MHFLYGSKKGVNRRLVATFGSQQQLLAYVRWGDFEVPSASTEASSSKRLAPWRARRLGGFHASRYPTKIRTKSLYNPTPSML